MEVDDSYKELGIPRDSSDAEVKAAWRRLAARWHPDRNDSPAALRKIQRINRAIEEIRKARRISGFGDAASPEEAPSYDEAPPRDEAASPGASEAAGAGTARTFHHTVSLTLEEACAGCVKDIVGEVIDDCGACAATGTDPRPGTCATCEGTGQVRQGVWFGWLSTPAECPDCRGTGERPQACAACEGSGKTAPRSYRCRVRIPAGMRHGGHLQAPLRARSREGGRGETLSIAIDLLPHPIFSLDDDGTVRCEVPVDGFAWTAQRWTEVPTPAGMQQMRLRRGHLVYRIKGRGFPLPGGRERADCLVTVAPLFPETLSEEQEALIDGLVASHSGDAASPAGERVAAWAQTLAAWQQALPRADTRTGKR